MTGKIPAIATHYAGRKYKSRTEARWAVLFDACGIPYWYEFEGHDLGSTWYLPDFWLPSPFNLFFEVKGEEPDSLERMKCSHLARDSGQVVLIGVGQPEALFQILWFDGTGEEDGLRYVIAWDRNPNAGLWLVSDDDGDSSRVFGMTTPPNGERHLGPMFTGPMAMAYELALSAEFERGHGRERVRPLVKRWAA